jgi:hypothetical protein
MAISRGSAARLARSPPNARMANPTTMQASILTVLTIIASEVFTRVPLVFFPQKPFVTPHRSAIDINQYPISISVQ